MEQMTWVQINWVILGVPSVIVVIYFVLVKGGGGGERLEKERGDWRGRDRRFDLVVRSGQEKWAICKCVFLFIYKKERPSSRTTRVLSAP